MMENPTRDKETPRETLTQEFKVITLEYVARVNSRYRANEFTSSQLAKNIMTTTDIAKTRFPIVHRIVKEILGSWQEQGLCTHISRTKYSRCRKTKDTYRFNKQGMTEIKKRIIEETIRTIGKSEPTSTSIMRTRGSILKDRLDEILDSVMRNSQPAEENEI